MLIHLKYTECPVCGAKVKMRTQDGVPHSNGQFFETIEFRCITPKSISGCIIQWSPNFCSEELVRGCPAAHTLCLKLKTELTALKTAADSWDDELTRGREAIERLKTIATQHAT